MLGEEGCNTTSCYGMEKWKVKKGRKEGKGKNDKLCLILDQAGGRLFGEFLQDRGMDGMACTVG